MRWAVRHLVLRDWWGGGFTVGGAILGQVVLGSVGKQDEQAWWVSRLVSSTLQGLQVPDLIERDPVLTSFDEELWINPFLPTLFLATVLHHNDCHLTLTLTSAPRSQWSLSGLWQLLPIPNWPITICCFSCFGEVIGSHNFLITWHFCHYSVN